MMVCESGNESEDKSEGESEDDSESDVEVGSRFGGGLGGKRELRYEDWKRNQIGDEIRSAIERGMESRIGREVGDKKREFGRENEGLVEARSQIGSGFGSKKVDEIGSVFGRRNKNEIGREVGGNEVRKEFGKENGGMVGLSQRVSRIKRRVTDEIGSAAGNGIKSRLRKGVGDERKGEFERENGENGEKSQIGKEVNKIGSVFGGKNKDRIGRGMGGNEVREEFGRKNEGMVGLSQRVSRIKRRVTDEIGSAAENRMNSGIGKEVGDEKKKESQRENGGVVGGKSQIGNGIGGRKVDKIGSVFGGKNKDRIGRGMGGDEVREEFGSTDSGFLDSASMKEGSSSDFIGPGLNRREPNLMKTVDVKDAFERIESKIAILKNQNAILAQENAFLRERIENLEFSKGKQWRGKMEKGALSGKGNGESEDVGGMEAEAIEILGAKVKDMEEKMEKLVQNIKEKKNVNSGDDAIKSSISKSVNNSIKKSNQPLVQDRMQQHFEATDDSHLEGRQRRPMTGPFMSDKESRLSSQGLAWPNSQDCPSHETWKESMHLQIKNATNMGILERDIISSIRNHWIKSGEQKYHMILVREDIDSMDAILKAITDLDPEPYLSPEEKFRQLEQSEGETCMEYMRKIEIECHGYFGETAFKNRKIKEHFLDSVTMNGLKLNENDKLILRNNPDLMEIALFAGQTLDKRDAEKSNLVQQIRSAVGSGTKGGIGRGLGDETGHKFGRGNGGVVGIEERTGDEIGSALGSGTTSIIGRGAGNEKRKEFGGGNVKRATAKDVMLGLTSDGDKVCFRCAQMSHLARCCSNDRYCAVCGQVSDHTTRNCRSINGPWILRNGGAVLRPTQLPFGGGARG